MSKKFLAKQEYNNFHNELIGKLSKVHDKKKQRELFEKGIRNTIEHLKQLNPKSKKKRKPEDILKCFEWGNIHTVIDAIPASITMLTHSHYCCKIIFIIRSCKKTQLVFCNNRSVLSYLWCLAVRSS